VADPLASSQSTGVYRSILNRQLDGGSIAFNVSASTDMLQRLQLSSVLKGHHGCVNTVSFAPDGQLLISGSDDLSICFWDWNAGEEGVQQRAGCEQPPSPSLQPRPSPCVFMIIFLCSKATACVVPAVRLSSAPV
jgi:WD40 repeat protein